MNPFYYIRAWFIWLTQYLVQAALDCYNSPLLPDFLGDIFNLMSTWTAQVAGYLYDVSSWYDNVTSKIGQILSWSSIWSLIKSYVPNLEALSSWFYSWATNVTGVIDTWWSAMSSTVRGWIAVAVQEVAGALGAWTDFWNNLWPAWVASFNGLKTAWDAFWTTTVPQLVRQVDLWDWWDDRLGDIQDLVNGAIRELAPFWEGWQEIRTTVLTFFQDPIGYLWERFADWFLGPEG